MNFSRRSLLAAGLACALLLCASPSPAAFDLLGGRAIKVGARKATIKFVRDLAVRGEMDPRCLNGLGSAVLLTSPTHDRDPIALPCGNWAAIPGGFLYKDSRGEAGGLTKLLYRAGRLLMKFKGDSFLPVLGPLESLEVGFNVGPAFFCGRFTEFRDNFYNKVSAYGPTDPCQVAATTTTLPAPTTTLPPTTTTSTTTTTSATTTTTVTTTTVTTTTLAPTTTTLPVTTTSSTTTTTLAPPTTTTTVAPPPTTSTTTTLPSPECGNGLLEPGEACDDGNQDSGDCCAADCALEAAGSPCAGDGNSCTADTCDGLGTCGHAPDDTAACDDSNECTTADRCEAGACVGSLVAPWINEVNYDGFDFFLALRDHEEFVEIAAPAGVDLGGYRLLSVEGEGFASGFLTCDTGWNAEGDAYFEAVLPAGTVVEDHTGTGVGFVTVCFEDTSGAIEDDGACDVMVTNTPSSTSNLKNGALGNLFDCADGALLLSPGGQFTDAVSWEGSIDNKGDYGAFFQDAPNIGRDEGSGTAPRRSLAKISATLAREPNAAKWSETPSGGDSPGEPNDGQALSCLPSETECGNTVLEFGEDCEVDAHCGSGWHCVGCWCEPAEGRTYTKTKYPIVLAHGFLGFDAILGVDYWFGLTQALVSGGADVFVTEVSAINASEVRGEQLITQIEDILAVTGAEKVNLIGHSQGALDIRYVAAVRPDLIASVTGVAGPHTGGVDFAAFLDDALPADSPQRQLVIAVVEGLGALIGWLSGSENPSDVEAALANFTREGTEAFNAAYPQGLPSTECGEGAPVVDGIRYYSWTGVGARTTGIDPSDSLFEISSLFFDSPNDGLVEQCSAHLGRVLRDDYFHNHLDEVNQFFGIVPLFEQNPASIFRAHANRLKNAGL